MKLLIDLGNSRLKWATLRDGQLQRGGVFAHVDKALAPALHTEWASLPRIDEVLAASVVGAEREQELAHVVRERFQRHVAIPRSPASALGVRNAYAEPARLGIDRFLGMAALRAERARALVLVSVGTALTLDALDADGRHHGGLIVAGPQLMREALLANTARVGTFDGVWREMPTSTADGVFAGSLYAAVGAIERFCAVAARDFGTAPALFLTGGGADDIEALLPGAERVHDLVLRGLALWSTQVCDADG
jgi:type III pantothenate kinase